jgi:hypothetical protein
MCNAGLSCTAFYSSIHKGIDAINRCPDLALMLPQSLEELHNAADKFALLSRDRLLNGCVLALDGWLCWIKVPGSKETPNVSSYFLAIIYVLNVQATCDAQSRFTYVFVLCHGGSRDSRAYQASELHFYIDALPPGFYGAADNAYTLSEHLLIPYSGVGKNLYFLYFSTADKN